MIAIHTSKYNFMAILKSISFDHQLLQFWNIYS